MKTVAGVIEVGRKLQRKYTMEKTYEQSPNEYNFP